jgi:hypothetical protein
LLVVLSRWNWTTAIVIVSQAIFTPSPFNSHDAMARRAVLDLEKPKKRVKRVLTDTRLLRHFANLPRILYRPGMGKIIK